MKLLLTIAASILIGACQNPLYITSHGTHIYHSCGNPHHPFPTPDEMEAYLDHLTIHSPDCLPTDPVVISDILSYMAITLACHPPSGKHYDRYFRDDILVEWQGYDCVWTLYHEIMHPLYRYYRGGTDRDHLDKPYWEGARCLTRLFEQIHGWVI